MRYQLIIAVNRALGALACAIREGGRRQSPLTTPHGLATERKGGEGGPQPHAQSDWQLPAVHTNYIFNQLEGGCSINLPHIASESPWSWQEGPELMTPAQL